jgi:N-acetylmuramoyl-L-alanine amidase
VNSYRNPLATWLGSPNYTERRAGHDMSQPSWVVLHTMVGTLAGANARFQQPGQAASAHYGVGLDGRLVQWVDERDAAWTNGATARDGIGDNLDSITIEHEDGGNYDGPRTPALYAASARLVRDICRRYGVPIDRHHIIGHRECTYAQTACPDGLDVDRIVREAAASIADAAPKPGEGDEAVGGHLIRDPIDPSTLWEVYADATGSLRVGFWPGGIGQMEGFAGSLNSFGRPTAAPLADAEGVFSQEPEGWRLNVRGLDADGERYVLALSQTNAQVLPGAGWTHVPSKPAQSVPAASSGADEPLRAYLKAGPA